MENTENLERIATEHIKIAKNEKQIAMELRKKAKNQINKSKAREDLAQRGIELAKVRKELSEKTKNLIKNKIAVKELLDYSDLGLKVEEDQAVYNEKLAEIQIEIAGIHKKIARIERKLAEENKKLIEEKISNANLREKLGKKLLSYTKILRSGASDEKKKSAKEIYLSQQQNLIKSDNKIVEKSEDIKKIQISLSDSKKELSQKLSEREKIKP
jgi:hypothetical protein